MLPERLYKYLPSKYVDNMYKKGELLFRNLTYFKRHEDTRRGDPLEGHHRDNPDNDIEITINATGKKIKGDFSFLNSTNSDVVYVFCMSTIHSRELYDEFNSDACIEITDVKNFLLRVRVKLKHLISCHKLGLLHGNVKYYAADKPAEFNIKNPIELVFAKDELFRKQNEYRLVFGKKGAFELEQSIVINKHYSFKEEAMKGTPEDKIIRLGDISGISTVKYINN